MPMQIQALSEGVSRTDKLLDDLFEACDNESLSMRDLLELISRVEVVLNRQFKKLDKDYSEFFEQIRKACIDDSVSIMKSKKVLVLTLAGAALHASSAISLAPGAAVSGVKLVDSKLPTLVSDAFKKVIGWNSHDLSNPNGLLKFGEDLGSSVDKFGTATDAIANALRNWNEASRTEKQALADSAKSRKDECKGRSQEAGGRAEEMMRQMRQTMEKEFSTAIKVASSSS